LKKKLPGISKILREVAAYRVTRKNEAGVTAQKKTPDESLAPVLIAENEKITRIR
jgi:hypothetical protein